MKTPEEYFRTKKKKNQKTIHLVTLQVPPVISFLDFEIEHPAIPVGC